MCRRAVMHSAFLPSILYRRAKIILQKTLFRAAVLVFSVSAGVATEIVKYAAMPAM